MPKSASKLWIGAFRFDLETPRTESEPYRKRQMSSSNSTAKENTQMSHQAVRQPALDPREPESPAVAFERVLNTEEAAALLQIHPKILQKMAREGTVPGL